MSAVALPAQNEHEKVVEWRLFVLERAGYDTKALLLAENLTVDLHEAVELLEQGCSVETAVEILT